MRRSPMFAVVAAVSLAVVPTVPGSGAVEVEPSTTRAGAAACVAATDLDVLSTEGHVPRAEEHDARAASVRCADLVTDVAGDDVSAGVADDDLGVSDAAGDGLPAGDMVADAVPLPAVTPGGTEPVPAMVPPDPEPVVDESDEPITEEPVDEEPVDEADVAAVADPAGAVQPDDLLAPLPAPEGPTTADTPGDDALIDELVDVPVIDSGLRAEIYDGIYARGVPVAVAMAATRELESGGNYGAEAGGSSASGAYQVIDSTWNGYGGYARAVDAPPGVQDQFAYESMVVILKRYGNDVSSIPVAWYYPIALRDSMLMDVVPAPWAGNVLTPRQYQARWMAAFHRHLEAGSPVFLPADTDALIPAIAFPVLGPTSFWDDWHAPRDGGARRHEGLDFMGEAGQPLRAAFDGVVTGLRPTDIGIAGVGITITREDGLRANYFHLDAALRWHPDLELGDRVRAGQIIAFMGATGNAGIPHLHFELRTPEGQPVAPYPAVLEAVQREQCSVGIGPWSTVFSSPGEIAEALTRLAVELEALGPDFVLDVPEPDVVELQGPGGARWTISSDGSVTATGSGALVAPDQGACEQTPAEVFGSGAAGLAVDSLPLEWWGDDVDPSDLAAMLAAVEAERVADFRSAVARGERTAFRSSLRFRQD